MKDLPRLNKSYWILMLVCTTMGELIGNLAIHAQTGIPKSAIRKALLKGGVYLRDVHPKAFSRIWKTKGKQAGSPPYGFCYFHGSVVRHPKEYQTLFLIHQLWQKGVNPNAIGVKLNSRRIPSRMAKRWRWNNLKNLTDRFEKKQINYSGGKFEFR